MSIEQRVAEVDAAIAAITAHADSWSPGSPQVLALGDHWPSIQAILSDWRELRALVDYDAHRANLERYKAIGAREERQKLKEFANLHEGISAESWKHIVQLLDAQDTMTRDKREAGEWRVQPLYQDILGKPYELKAVALFDGDHFIGKIEDQKDAAQIVSDHEKAAMFDAMLEHRLVLYLRADSAWGCEDEDGFERGFGPTPVDAVKDALARLA